MQASWPDPFPQATFLFPVVPPSSDPDSLPALTVQISCEWLPYVRGALTQLAQQATWKSSDPAQVLLAQQRAMTLISLFTECSGPPAWACPYDLSFSSVQWTLHDWGTYYTPNTIGQWFFGFGWENTGAIITGSSPVINVSGVAIEIHIPPTTITRATMFYDLTKGDQSPPGTNNNTVGLWTGNALIAHQSVDQATDPDGTGKQLEVTGNYGGIDRITAFVQPENAANGVNTGHCRIYRMEVAGQGSTIC